MRSRKRQKSKWKMISWVVGIPALAVILIVLILLYEREGEGISRAVAVRSMALALASPEELAAWKEEYGASHFPADLLEEWYVPYFDYLYEHGQLSEEETPASEESAEGMLTYGEADRMAGAVSDGLRERIRAGKKNRDKDFPQEQWWLFYDSLLKETDPEQQVEKRQICVYGTPENVTGAPAWTVYTSAGRLSFRGLALDGYIDHQLLVMTRGNEIIRVLEDESGDVTYRNVWLIEGDERGLLVFVGDIERRIPFKGKTEKLADCVHNLADLQLSEGKVTGIAVKKDRIRGKLLSVQPDAVEIEGYGRVPLDEECKILKTCGQLTRQEPEEVLIGYDIQDFVTAKGKICAILTTREFDAGTIRVLLMDSGFQSLTHEAVTLVCDSPVTVAQGEKTWEIPAGEETSFTAGDERLSGGRMIFTAPEGAEIRVPTLEREMGQPSYGGRLELLDTEDGLVLINELYLEDYLKKVIPSEMPSGYEKEALKAQAVCARTYAYRQIQTNTYSQYGAHVDDSTNFQVYNNCETDERTAAAVDETYGEMLFYEGDPISAYYFSTSCGVTADGSVWGSDPTKTPYLQAAALQPGRKPVDLTSEEDFSSFIRRQDYPAYDASYPFYRWNVVTDGKILTAHIGGVGDVKKIRVTGRTPGGAASELTVTGTGGEKIITGQNNIRAALGDGSLSIARGDGKTVTGWSSLPSGFLTVEELGDDGEGTPRFRIWGGGYGHGVGMSQNGAQGMAVEGMNYKTILQFFYNGVTIE